MGQILSPPPPPPPPTVKQRIVNFFWQHGRGIFGSIPIIALMVMLLIAQDDLKTKPEKVVLFIYLIMFCCLLFQPINAVAASYLPVFTFPLLHVIESNVITRTYFCANTALMVVGGYLHQLINVSGWDKRFATLLIFGSEGKPISTVGLVVKSSLAAYVLSLFTSRQHTTKYIMEMVVGSMRSSKKTGGTPVNAILAHAISSSAIIGSMGMVISARNVMFMRSLWEMSNHPDTFNFLDYFVFAFPVTLIMFLLNLGYNIMMAKIVVKNELTDAEFTQYQKIIAVYNDAIPPKPTVHEILTIIFTFLSLSLYFTRWSSTLFKIAKIRGWADTKKAVDKTGNTKIPDVTIAAIMLIVCCILPTTFNFAKIMTAKTENDLPPAKPDSPIVFWKVVDKNTNYGYMFLVGGFCALDTGVRKTDFASSYLYDKMGIITKSSLPISILMWCALGGLLSNLMTSVGASGMLTILALNSYAPDNALLKNHYQFILATGMSTGVGFFTHFKFTPMYTVKSIAGVSTFTQIKYNAGSILICIMVLWAGIFLYAPIIFE